MKKSVWMSLAFSLGTAFASGDAAFADNTPKTGAPPLNSRGCDPGFHYAGPAIGCVGQTLTDRAVVQAFDQHNAPPCTEGEKRTIKVPGVMPNGRHVTWDVVQTCHKDK